MNQARYKVCKLNNKNKHDVMLSEIPTLTEIVNTKPLLLVDEFELIDDCFNIPLNKKGHIYDCTCILCEPNLAKESAPSINKTMFLSIS